MMWYVGFTGIILAGFCGYTVNQLRARLHEMITTETYAVQQLLTLQKAAAQAAGIGYFRQKCEVAGKVEPGPSGTVRSELSGTECVWHKHVVTRKYWETARRDNSGSYSSRRVERKERVTEHESGEPFLVNDETGTVKVHPGKALEHMRRVVNRFEPYEENQQGTKLSVGKFSLTLPTRRREGTIGYEYEEWVLEPGTQVYVLGEANDTSGKIVIDQPSLVSTKSEEELMRDARSKQKFHTVAGGIGVVAGVAFLLIAWLSGVEPPWADDQM
jgi:hypothetical protein